MSNTPERRNLCVLVAEIIHEGQLIHRSDSSEITHALERCTNRVHRAIDGHDGNIIAQNEHSFSVTFENCDSGILATCEMLNRVLSLPPLSGTQLNVRIGLHYGLTNIALENDASIEISKKLAHFCLPGQALVSGATLMLLSSSTRHFVGSEPIDAPELKEFPWPVYVVGNRFGMITSIAPQTRIAQRLRLRHQQEVILVEELRPTVLLGRELGNDLVIIDPRASRQHARIERRPEGFVLIDSSTNGTYVAVDGNQEQCLKKRELPLVGPGRIGCGFSANEVDRDLVFFDIV